MSVHYKFKSALEYDTVTFDGLHISVKDLKNSIVQQKRIGKSSDFDLQVTNAQTKEIYEDESALIPKNTSLLIARIPSSVQNKAKVWEGYGNDNTPAPRLDEGGPAAKAVDLSSLDASEDDKIKAMMSQSTQDYDPSNYMKIRGANQVGAVPANYRCYKCHQTGHWIKDCPLGQGSEQIEIKKSTGIPRSFMVPVEGPQVQGAMMTPFGSYAVPALDHQTYTQKHQPAAAALPPTQKSEIPDDLLCSICSDLLTDAVMIPCCGNSFCDECIRSSLLESEEHECPDCHERDISPGTLIPNRFLRNSVANFKNSTGYVKQPSYRPAPQTEATPVQIEPTVVLDAEDKNPIAPSEEPKTETIKSEENDTNTQKTVISEADSTEASKTPVTADSAKDSPKPAIEEEKSPRPDEKSTPEMPPGVSPPAQERAPEETHPIVAVNSHRERPTRDRDGHRRRSKERTDRSPRHRRRRSPHRYRESSVERPGTPTVDEPGMGGLNNGNDRNYQASAPYPSGPPTLIGSSMPHHHQQHPPPGMNAAPQYQPSVQQYPSNQSIHGPPPNFRLPPPGAGAPPSYMPGMYNVSSQRGVYEPGRGQSMPSGPAPYQNYSSRSRNREFGHHRGMRGRTPPGIIDDPLEAFNRMLREKDERERRAKMRKGRSYSRSSSRSYSRSPRRRSRSPRRRSRSRSKSFTMSRSRSRSAGKRAAASPPPHRDYSPRRRPPSRFRSPARNSSPPPRYRYKDGPERKRDREFERERDRERERERERDDYSRNKRGYSRERMQQQQQQQQQPPPGDYRYGGGYDGYEGRSSSKAMAQGHRGGDKWGSMGRGDMYYGDAPPAGYGQQMAPPGSGGGNTGGGLLPQPTSMPQHPSVSNSIDGGASTVHFPTQSGAPAVGYTEITVRYPPRDPYNPYKTDHIPPLLAQPVILPRRYEDVAPPGTEQPLPPGEEPSPRFDDRYMKYDPRSGPTDAPPIDRYSPQPMYKEMEQRYRDERYGEMVEMREGRERRSSKERAESSDRHKKRKRDETPEKSSTSKRDEKKRDHSDDEKSRKSRDKKKKRDRKESDKKKKRDKKDKHKDKDKSGKQEHENSPAREEQHRSPVKLEREHKSPKRECRSTKSPERVLKSPLPKHSPPQVAVSSEDQEPNPVVATPEKMIEQRSPTPEQKTDLYADILSGGIDNTIVESYGKMDDDRKSDTEKSPSIKEDFDRTPDKEVSKEYDDILELHTGELKSELDKEVLPLLPEKSKWELDDEPSSGISDIHQESKTEKSNKVTNEVLKRAENAIFAKAINAIRPIEIKKISQDRAKLYSGEKDEKKQEDLMHIEQEESQEDVMITMTEPVKIEPDPPKPVRLSVKERLGCKVDDLDRIVRIDKGYDRNRSRTLSPFSRRAQDARREIEEKRRDHDKDRHRGTRGNDRRERDRDRDHRDRGRRDDRRERDRDKEKSRRDRSSSRSRREEEAKRKRSRSRSDDRKHKRRDKKDKHQKKEKPARKHKKEEENEEPVREEVREPEKRKPTIDEAAFVPDYDIESESDSEKREVKKRSAEPASDAELAGTAKKRAKTEEKKDSSSSSSSSSSSEDEKKRKKHKKHRRRKKRDSSSSSSDSDSSSSDDDKEKKRRKHKKKQKKKKKKSKHK